MQQATLEKPITGGGKCSSCMFWEPLGEIQLSLLRLQGNWGECRSSTVMLAVNNCSMGKASDIEKAVNKSVLSKSISVSVQNCAVIDEDEHERTILKVYTLPEHSCCAIKYKESTD